MKFSPSLLITLGLFTALGIVLVAINQDSKPKGPETWSAFIYTHGFDSGRYIKEDDFGDYASCKAFAIEKSQAAEGAPWECGSYCRFDSRRQGFQCEQMRND
ncbi:hypothetical protein [Shewanella algae]|uniref:hypothetical protein n=1 Tax=Shewanella algae TaxID=38313 RepID=UPI003C68E9FE